MEKILIEGKLLENKEVKVTGFIADTYNHRRSESGAFYRRLKGKALLGGIEYEVRCNVRTTMDINAPVTLDEQLADAEKCIQEQIVPAVKRGRFSAYLVTPEDTRNRAERYRTTTTFIELRLILPTKLVKF